MIRRGLTLVELLIALAVGAVLVGLLLGAVQKVRQRAARAACDNNLRQLALGAQQFHAARGKFPPGFTTPRGDMPCLAWGARLLPQLDQSAAWQEVE